MVKPHYSLSMSNLVPEPRQDKNGKIVVRHVKVDVGGHTINMPIPAPRPVASNHSHIDPVEALRGDLSYAIMEATLDFDSAMDDPEGENDLAREGIYKHLQTYPEELVTALESTRVNDESFFHELARRVEQRETARFINNVISYDDLVYGDGDQKNSMIRALDYYPELNQGDGIIADGSEEDSKARAILAITSVMYKHADNSTEGAEKAIRWEPHDYDFLPSPVIKDKALSDYILANPERATDIAKAINERKAFMLERIKVVMEHPEAPLADGAL